MVSLFKCLLNIWHRNNVELNVFMLETQSFLPHDLSGKESRVSYCSWTGNDSGAYCLPEPLTPTARDGRIVFFNKRNFSRTMVAFRKKTNDERMI